MLSTLFWFWSTCLPMNYINIENNKELCIIVRITFGSACSVFLNSLIQPPSTWCCYRATQNPGCEISQTSQIFTFQLLFLLSVQQWKHWHHICFTTMRRVSCENASSKQLIIVSVKITCAEKSMSLGSSSLHPSSLFKKSSRLPKDKTGQETVSGSRASVFMSALYVYFLNVWFECFFECALHRRLADLKWVKGSVV